MSNTQEESKNSSSHTYWPTSSSAGRPLRKLILANFQIHYRPRAHDPFGLLKLRRDLGPRMPQIQDLRLAAYTNCHFSSGVILGKCHIIFIDQLRPSNLINKTSLLPGVLILPLIKARESIRYPFFPIQTQYFTFCTRSNIEGKIFLKRSTENW